MKNLTTLAALSTLAVGSAAMADLSNVVGQDTLRYYAADGSTPSTLGSASYAVLDLYVQFNSANTHGFTNAESRMLSAYDTNFSTSFGNFYQSDITGIGSGDGDGSWKPSFSFDIPGNANSAIDSFLTIGGGVGSEAVKNLTTPDPNLGQGTNPDIFNENIGWYLNPPNSSQGDALGTDYEVWIGRFVVTGDQARGGAAFSIAGTIAYNYGSNTGLFSGGMDGDFVFTPAPGALALMGLGGMYGRRRRA